MAVPVVAIAAFELLHEPPLVVELNVVELPLHNVRLPVMAAGIVPTVTTIVLAQPEGNV
jgi:hypothetical protein